MKIGARVLKTGLAITLSIMLSDILTPNNSPALAAIAAVTTTAPSVRQSFEQFQRRVLSNTIGAIIGVLMTLTIGNSPLATGLGVIILITLLNKLKLSDVLTLAAITLVVVMSYSEHSLYVSSIFRVVETLIGVTVSTLVNIFIYPPKYDDRFFKQSVITSSEIIMLSRASLRKNISFPVMEKDLVKIHKDFSELINLYDLIKSEIIFFEKDRMKFARKLVAYRNILASIKAIIHLEDVLHQNDLVFKTFPNELRTMIRERVETLLNGHEQILLKFEGKIPPNEVQFLEVTPEYRMEFVKRFYRQSRIEIDREEVYEAEINGIAHIMSAIYSYEEALFKMNKIVTIYKQRYMDY